MINQLTFLEDKKTREIFEEAIPCIPPDCEVYLVSGSVRNSLYYHFFWTKLPQRDFDAVVIWNSKKFVDNLKSAWWEDSWRIIKTNWIILYKVKKWANNRQNFNDCVYLDLIFSDPEQTILENLENHANFTINGWAINLKNIFSDDWLDRIIILPMTIEDIKNKQLKLNDPDDSFGIFACMRFISQWFKKPSEEEIELMIRALKNTKKDRFERNISKLYNYVWGEKKARDILKKLWIEKDIFNYETATSS